MKLVIVIRSYDTGVTQFLISYSVSPEFNEPEIDDYDEYDPTPYGGGYNIVAQYGRPLPHSNETCYPKGGSSSPPDLKPPNLVGAIVPVSVGGNEAIADDEQAAKPIKDISLPVQLVNEEKQQQKSEEQAVDDGRQVLAIENGDDTKSPGETNQGEVYSSGFGSGRGLYDQVPSGYGLEAMDICESLFGYWPCLSRDLKRSNCESVNSQRFSYEERYEDPWKGTADYLFGSSNPYGERTTYHEYEGYRR
ncbi:uncharacterized protein LOC126788272 [Argentina anserina]|uniref:uncharacterized protein LOC126788272 n=1 Tax=Argentina anserina TaxID=57926 RepID=UPI0021767D2A|nr:uncharacterized protein LOC126788272 [Potentilla anserina]